MLAALLYPAVACAQFLPAYDGVRLARMGYVNTQGEDGVSIYHYRRDGVLGAGTWLLTDRSRYSANYYVYDDKGRMVEKYREFSEGRISTQRFEHDAAGNVIRESYERSDGRSGYADFTWDDAGRLLTADCRKLRGWFVGFVQYEYEDGRLVSATITRDEQPYGAIRYVYDDSGRLVEETWDLAGGKWSQTFTYEYEPLPARHYSASSPFLMMNPAYRVTAESYDFNSKGGGPSHYTYDDEGRLVKKVFERSDGLRTETNYTFDGLGNLVSSHRVYHDGRTADFLYSYDDAMRLIGKTFTQSTGEEGFEEYHYDRLGRLVGATYRNMDFWLNGELSFAYDDWGHLDSGRFSGRDGFDAELDFDTDDQGNVLRMHWAFSNGTTQTYTFDYDLDEGSG
jgi:YD repeat-containing protein